MAVIFGEVVCLLVYITIPVPPGVQSNLFFRIRGRWDKGQEMGVKGVT